MTTPIHGAFASGNAYGFVDLEFSTVGRQFSHRFVVLKGVKQIDLILGVDWFRQNNILAGTKDGKDVLEIEGESHPLLAVDTSSAVLKIIQSAIDREFTEKDLINFLTPEEEDVRETPPDSSSLLETQLNAIKSVIQSYSDTIVDVLEESGRVITPEGMKIETGSSKPRFSPPRRLNPKYREALEKIVKRMIDQGILVPYNGPWGSPMFLVPKSNGEWRGVIDYRPLNEDTEDDRHPLPLIDEILAQFNGTKYYTIFDGVEGYHQFRLDPDSIGKSAITTPFGNFAPTVVTFGLKNAPSFFQRQMATILKGHEAYCMVYLDDIIIFSATFEEHLIHIKQVLAALRKVNFKIKRSKCRWAQSEVHFLGHKVTRDGLAPNPETVKRIVESGVPKNLKQLRGFLGLSGYYRKFIKGYSDIARPLHDLTKNDVKFEFGAKQVEAFEKLKAAIVSPPVLAYPNLEKPFILETDASGIGIGAVLSQVGEDGKEHPVAFFSKSLNSAQQNYATVDREALAIYAAILHWESYLEGNNITVRTDQQSLAWIFKKKDAILHSGRTARMMDRIQHLQLSVSYKPGASNQVADWCSRSPCIQVNFMKHVVPDEGILFKVGGVECTIAEWQQKCEETRALIDAVKLRDEKKDSKAKIVMPEAWKHLSRHLPHLTLLDEILVFNHEREKGAFRPRIVAPSVMRPNLLFDFHDSKGNGCHQGRDRTKQSIASRFWWPNLDADVKKHVHECSICTETQNKREKAGLLQAMEPVGGVGDRIAVDWIGPLPESENKNKYCLVIVDHYSRFPWTFPARNKDAATFAKIIMGEIEPVIGPPKELLSDQGAELIGEISREITAMMHTKKLTTTAYHPQTNGMVERFNGTLKSYLKKILGDKKDQWETYLPHALSVYRKTPHAVTKYSPHELMFGKPANTAYDEGWTRVADDAENSGDLETVPIGSLHKYYMKMRSQARIALTESSNISFERNKKRYDKGRVERKFKAGDRVWRRVPLTFTGVFEDMRKGPYHIIGPGKGSNTYVVEKRAGKTKTYNVDQLEPYIEPRVAPETITIIREKDKEKMRKLAERRAALSVPVEQKEVPPTAKSPKQKALNLETPAASIVPPPEPPQSAPKLKPAVDTSLCTLLDGHLVKHVPPNAKEVIKTPGKAVPKYLSLSYSPVAPIKDEKLDEAVNKFANTNAYQHVTLVADYLRQIRKLELAPLAALKAVCNEFEHWKNLNRLSFNVIYTLKKLTKSLEAKDSRAPLESALSSMIQHPAVWFFD